MLTNPPTRCSLSSVPALAGLNRRPIYISALFMFMVLLLPSPAQALSNCTPLADWGVSEPAVAERVVLLTNAHRARLGLRKQVVSPALTRAATWKALHMAKHNYYAHPDQGVGPGDGRLPWDRAADCGYPPMSATENINAGFESRGDADGTVDSWLRSPGHRTTLEHTAYVATGVGVATDARGVTYWVQMFGSVDDSAAPGTVAAAADRGRTIFGQPVLLSVLANDDPLASLHSIATRPAHGTVQIVGRQVRYTPKPGFVGTDRFSYHAAGLDGSKAQAQVTVTVSPLQLKASLSTSTVRASALAKQRLVYSVKGRAAVRYSLYRVGQARALRVSSPRTLSNSSATVLLSTVFGQTPRKAGLYRVVVSAAQGPSRTLNLRLT